MSITLTVKVNPATGDYDLYGEDGDRRSSGSLFDVASLGVDVCAVAEVGL